MGLLSLKGAGRMYQKYLPGDVKRWPRWLRWIEPHRAESRERMLLRCSCGRLYWMDAPKELLSLHLGHKAVLATNGSVWEFVKMKLGRLNKLTVRERLQRKGWL